MAHPPNNLNWIEAKQLQKHLRAMKMGAARRTDGTYVYTYMFPTNAARDQALTMLILYDVHHSQHFNENAVIVHADAKGIASIKEMFA